MGHYQCSLVLARRAAVEQALATAHVCRYNCAPACLVEPVDTRDLESPVPHCRQELEGRWRQGRPGDECVTGRGEKAIRFSALAAWWNLVDTADLKSASDIRSAGSSPAAATSPVSDLLRA